MVVGMSDRGYQIRFKDGRFQGISCIGEPFPCRDCGNPVRYPGMIWTEDDERPFGDPLPQMIMPHIYVRCVPCSIKRCWQNQI